MTKEVILEKEGPVARLVVNRPDKHNALSFAGLDQLVEALHEAEDDDAIKVIILKGRGPSFCAGHDYDDAVQAYGLAHERPEGKPKRPSQRVRLQRDRKLAMNYMAFQYSIKPVIAQVQGHCIGAGMSLVALVGLSLRAGSAHLHHPDPQLVLSTHPCPINP